MIAVRRPIRILFTISDLRGGGAEREFSILVRHLSRARFEPHLCFWRPVFAYQPPEGVPVHMIEKSRPWHVFRAIAALRRLIDELRPDLVFSQLHYVNMVTGSALAKTRHRPRWVCRQVNDPRREMRGAFAVWARRSLRRADRALGCCDGVSRAMRQHLRLEAGRVSTMVNAVDVDRIRLVRMFREGKTVIEYADAAGEIQIAEVPLLFADDVLRAMALIERKPGTGK